MSTLGSTKESLLKYRAALVAAGLLWSLGGLFIKSLTANQEWHSSALGITFYRSLFAALCLAPLLRGRKLPRLRDSLVAILFYTLLLGLYVASTQGTTAANAIFLQYTAPLYAVVLGPLLFKEPFRRADAWALTLAMLGIAVLFFGNFQGGAQGPLLMGAGSGLMFGFFLVWLRHMRYADPVAVTAVNNAGVALLSAVALLCVFPNELTLVPRALLGDARLLPVAAAMALMGCVQIAIPYVLFSYGLKRIPAVEGSLLSLVEPLLNPVWVALFIGERPSGATVVGGLLIVAALAARYTLFRSTGPPAQPASP
ncbi:MAG TPA: EamA family transporter [Armatimonadota bacterium]|nr:EamA family transporter [Armatimonadota bacterium]